ncbi:MAG: hypothetical protein Q9190_000805 [Brigantiaea leucoxantha]
MDEGNASSPIDQVLISVQQALVPWQSVIQCHACHYDRDQSVLLVCAMSIRHILRRLQRLCFNRSYVSSPSPQAFDSASRAHPQNFAPMGSNVMLGNYTATENEQKHVTDFLVIQAFGKIRHVLVLLIEKFRHSQEQINAANFQAASKGNGSSLAGPELDLNFLQQLLHSLESTVQAIGGAISSRDSHG